MAENDNEKMISEPEKDPRLLYSDDEQESGIFRWMSALVVLLAIAGFFGLAWYAYKSGGEAVDEKDVEFVKADKAPVKETPANPGGMQIPNQDKTVYGLISGSKTEKPTVERILPAPEEPVARGGDTETWMSDKAKSKMNGAQETDKPANTASATTEVATAETKKTEQFNPSQAQALQSEQKPAAQDKPSITNTVVTTPSASAEATAAKPVALAANNSVQASETKKAVKPQPVVVPDSEEDDTEDKQAASPATKAPAAVVPPKGARAQLGAYKSEAEAKSNWAKISSKFATEIGSKEHYIVRADLGEKGIYYRLQVAPFASAKEAEQFCLTFVTAGQNCFLAKAK
jgi:hypothetical protein